MKFLLPILLIGFGLVLSLFMNFDGNKDLDEANRIQNTKTILDNLSKEKYEDVRKDFHSSLKNDLPSEKIAEVWQGIVAASGKFQNIVSVRTLQTQGMNQVSIRISFETENATLETTFTEDDRVIGLWIKP